MSTIPGIDVSHWQSGIDWPKVRASSKRLVFIKTSEGETYTDFPFADNWNGARTSGLLRGASCFFYPNQNEKTLDVSPLFGAPEVFSFYGSAPLNIAKVFPLILHANCANLLQTKPQVEPTNRYFLTC